ncbi:DNA polymerase III subunit delta' [Laspinema olomoucense]|uniref:DNA polymerase III subunit delta' n=1 Tax=Laspinema olomoucense TaxID=3231600 RepID=UPI0021BB4F00|nr:DNA polymerase III subunit delta' [Laspinema sp. D3c]MCT7993548.1 DNA polymerase III subunit delta' [Laspinema sp. D3c]
MTVFAKLIGQPQAIELLNQAVYRDRIAPAYLFAGAPGVGRSLAARYFLELLLTARNLGATPASTRKLENHPDLLWIEPTYLDKGKMLTATEAAATGFKRKSPPQIRLEQIRQIGEFLGRHPLEALRKVVVLEEAQTMKESAANGLLKTLEEPGRASIILIAPGVDSLLPTLVSRCQRIPFYRLTDAQMGEVLATVGYPQILENPAVLAMAQGSPGTAIACWEKLQEIPAELREKPLKPSLSTKQALEIAKEIDRSLDTESQLWLIEYLQQAYWLSSQQRGTFNPNPLHLLDRARRYLLSYASPRLVWEVTLMGMKG